MVVTGTVVVMWPLVQWHTEDRYFWADSPDVPGWTAAAETREDLRGLIDEAKAFVFAPLGWPRTRQGSTEGSNRSS